jgi:ribosomal protein S18 acetylase RimI-like enzyme
VAQIDTFDPWHADDIARLCAEQGWPTWTPDNVAKAFTAPGVIAVTAVDEGKVVGAAQLVTDGHVIGYLGLLIVERESRGKGIGRALVADVFERCGLTRIDLLSEPDSTSFYESLPNKVKPGYRIYRETR